jgi:hypothetical protein
MSSPNLVKVNKSFECKMICPDEPTFEAKLKAEFVDGSVWETPSTFDILVSFHNSIQKMSYNA